MQFDEAQSLAARLRDELGRAIIGQQVVVQEILTAFVSGRREIRFIPGPIFSNVILADEINRTPPKTQAALLEAMV